MGQQNKGGGFNMPSEWARANICSQSEPVMRTNSINRPRYDNSCSNPAAIAIQGHCSVAFEVMTACLKGLI